jgi:transposase-like protein
MIEPQIINVVCPHCSLTWMSKSEFSTEYFCCHCGFILIEEQARKAAWNSGSIYYGE